jgi:TP901 family phage tail tape measure protein
MVVSSSQFNKGFRSMSRTVTTTNFQSKLRKISNDLLGFRGIMFSLAIGTGAKKAINTVVDFETAFNRLSAITFAPKALMVKFRARARELGETTRFTASQVMGAMGELALRGLKGRELLTALPKTLTLAAGAAMALPEAAKFGITTIRQYALEITDLGRVNDVLAKAQTISGATIKDFQRALLNVGPIARVAGLDIEKTVAVLGTMAETGIVGSRAGTLLKNSLVKMLVPTKTAVKVFKQMEKLTKGKVRWKNFFSPEGKVNVEALVSTLEKFPHLQRVAMKLFNIRGGQALIALAGQGAGKLRDFEKALRSAAGFASEAARRQMAGLPGVFLMLKSAAESVELSLFGARGAGPVLSAVLIRFTGALRYFARMNPEMMRMVGIAALVSVGMMGLLVVLALTASAIGALLSPVGLAVVGVTALAASFGLAAIGAIELPKGLKGTAGILTRLWTATKGLGASIGSWWGRLKEVSIEAKVVSGAFEIMYMGAYSFLSILNEVARALGGLALMVVPGSWSQGWERVKAANYNVTQIPFKAVQHVQPETLMGGYRSAEAMIQGLIRVQADPGTRITEASIYPAHGPQLGVNMAAAR